MSAAALEQHKDDAEPRVRLGRGSALARFTAPVNANVERLKLADAMILAIRKRCEVMEGALGTRARRLVEEWRILHQTELLENWTRAQARQPLNRIEPLE
jgi:hypothetical protein